MENFLGVAEVARRLGLHRASLYRLIKSGRFPRPVRLTGAHGQAGGRIAWPEGEVERYGERLIASRDKFYQTGKRVHGK